MSALNVADAKTSKTCRLAGLSLQGYLAMYFREIILHVRLGHADQLILLLLFMHAIHGLQALRHNAPTQPMGG